jgi:hypothetical protein
MISLSFKRVDSAAARLDLNAQIRAADWLSFLSNIQINGNE